jgi:exodeoxyribonuclease V alpha subunit
MTTTPTTIELDPSQERAVALVCTARLGVITGGPGTGKTTCLRTALDRLDAAGGTTCPACKGRGVVDVPDEWGGDSYEDTCQACAGKGHVVSYALAAPTGKAARRMSEATGRDATTVHRLLAYGPTGDGGMGFNHHAERPLTHELVVVDEASMLDVELADALFQAIDPERTRLVLVGDVNQLPSVGPGRVFGDLIEAGVVPVARLEKLHRAAAESWVCSQAPRILAGELPDLATRKDFVWMRAEERDKAAQALVDVVTKHLPAQRGASGDAVQVLIPQRVGPAGGEALNVRLQALLNPAPAGEVPTWKVGPFTLREGDRVIQTSNDYHLSVMNGECGRVAWVRDKPVTCPVCEGKKTVEIDDEDARRTIERDCERCAGKGALPPGMGVRYPEGRGERLVEYSKSKAEGLSLAYALTIHKSQGSEWPWVVVFVHSTHTMMLTRQLLYTAITRARVGVVIVGDKAGLERAVKETKDASRNTALAERLRAA